MGRNNFIKIGLSLALCALFLFSAAGLVSDAWAKRPSKPKMYVGAMTILLTDRGGDLWRADVSVTILDQNTNPVSGATVTGDWDLSEAVYDSGASANTNGQGIAGISSEKIAYDGNVFKFTVTNVRLRGFSYDADANAATSVSATVSGAPDTTPPTVVSVAPDNGVTNVSVASGVVVTFSEAVQESTVNENSFKVEINVSGIPVAGARTFSVDSLGNTVATFTPTADFDPSTDYNVLVTTEVRDSSNNAMISPFTSIFTTGAYMPTLADEAYRLANNGNYYPDIRIFHVATQASTLYVQVRSNKIDYTRLKRSEVTLRPSGDKFTLIYNASGANQGTYTGSRTLSDIPTGETTVKILIEDRSRNKFIASPIIIIDDAVDEVSQPFLGVKWTHRTTSVPRPLNINVLQITLAEVNLFVSPGNPNGSPDSCQEAITSRTSTFVANYGLQVGINGDFSEALCGSTSPNEGVAASVAGLGVSSQNPDIANPGSREQYSPHNNRPALAFNHLNDAYIGWYSANDPFLEGVYNGVGGNKMLVIAGQPVDPATWDPLGGALELNPRTSVGLSSDGSTLIVIVIDGRMSGFSEGVTLPEMSQYLIEFGAETGLNLDGGGSSTMVFNSQTGPQVINYPADGAERVRPSHLGIYASPGDLLTPLAMVYPEETELDSNLWQNYPNPFNPETWIPFTLSSDAHVTIRIHSMNGQLVRRFDMAYMPAGVYASKDRAVYWNGRSEVGEQVSSGVYFYTIHAGDFYTTRKMTVLR